MNHTGPFHERRKETTAEIAKLAKTGDILYSNSSVYVYGIPFSNLVAKLSHSPYSHASMVLVEDDIYVVEVNEMGCIKSRIIDWLSERGGKQLGLYRYVNPLDEDKMKQAIEGFLAEDPDYDFTFTDSHRFYCTESVVYLYKQLGIDIAKPEMIKDNVPLWFYCLFYPVNWLLKTIVGIGLPTDVPVYFVGNPAHGMISSSRTYCVSEFHA